MAIGAEVESVLTSKFAALLPHLDERQRRLAMGAEARVLGHGGITVVARAAGVSAVTVSKGAAELEAGDEPLERVRRPGAGRKPLTSVDPGLVDALLAPGLVDFDRAADNGQPGVLGRAKLLGIHLHDHSHGSLIGPRRTRV